MRPVPKPACRRWNSRAGRAIDNGLAPIDNRRVFAEQAYLFRHALLRDVEPPLRGGEKAELCEAAGVALGVNTG